MSKLDDTTTPFAPFIPRSCRFRNLTGQRFGHWRVFGLFGWHSVKKATMWLCRCEGCKEWFVLHTGYLTQSNICACQKCAKKLLKAHITHGETLGGEKSAEYSCFLGAKERCNNPNKHCFKHYGGRGIKFRFASFAEFLATVGRKPTPQHSLDRYPNPNGHYEPGNVRWATKKEQSQNTRRNRFVTINGERKCMAEWCAIYQIHVNTATYRIDHGWDILKAFTYPTVRS